MSRAPDLGPLPSGKKIPLDVAAGILADAEGRVLIAERSGGDSLHGMWEFPGGKIAAGESAESALIRELQEELGIEVLDCTSFMRIEHDYPQRFVHLYFFKVSRWSGEPTGLEGQRLRWIRPLEIDAAWMLPADAPVIEALMNQQIAI
jgi:8-oxo-dGTP diphosphatase